MYPHDLDGERGRLMGLLDAFQAAERAGAEAVGRWIAACGDPRLRGGLRVIRARDARHAALAEARLRALGGVPGARPTRELSALCGVVADPGVSDRSKLAMLVRRLPEPDETPLVVEDRLEERASLRWLRRIRETLERETERGA